MTYSIKFDVPGDTAFAAITAAVTMLRKGVSLIGIVSAEPIGVTRMWVVVLKVSEDD